MASEGAPDLGSLMSGLGRRARKAAARLARAPAAVRDEALARAAARLRLQTPLILEANAADLASARERGLPAALLDRLSLDPARVEAMARAVEEVRALTDPLGRVLAEWTRPNGLRIRRVSVPLGVIGIIY